MLIALSVAEGQAGAVAEVVRLALVYAVHALLWASLAGALARVAARRAVIAAWLWKLALLGPLLTAALALSPAPARVPSAARVDEAVVTAAVATVREARLTWALDDGVLLAALAALACAASGIGLVGFALRAIRLVRSLGGRAPVRDPRLSARLSQLCVRSGLRGVRLSEQAWLPGPMVLGRREICIPAGVLDAFPDDEVDAILAHELAHLLHRDGVWFPMVALIEAALWAQPLTRWVARRCRQAAELAADDRAASLTRAPAALARALTRMAALRVTGAPVLWPALSPSASQVQRVARLLQAEPPRAAPLVAWAPVLALSLCALLAPGLRAELVGRAPPSVPALDPQALAEALDLLRAEAWSLEQELERAHASATDPARILELEQDLRHARANELWTEARAAAAHHAQR